MIRALLRGVCTPAPEVSGSDFTVALDALNTGSSLVGHWPMGADLNARIGGTAITAQGTHETGLPQLALGGIPSRAFDGAAAHGNVAPATNAAYVTPAGTVGMLIQPDSVAAKMNLVNLSDPDRKAGSFSLEINAGGGPRVFRRATGAAPAPLVEVTGSAGIVNPGRPYLIAATWGAGLHLYVMDANRAPGLIPGSDPTTTWTKDATFAAGQDIYIGQWHSEAVDHYDGILGHLFWFNRQLSLAELETLAPMVRQVSYLPSFNAGNVAQSATTPISMLNRGHPVSGFTLLRVPPNPDPGRTATVNGTSVDFAAGAGTGADDFGVTLTTAEGAVSALATVTVNVQAAASSTANPDTQTVTAGSGITQINVLTNDTVSGTPVITLHPSNDPARFGTPSPPSVPFTAPATVGAQTVYTTSYSLNGAGGPFANITVTVNPVGSFTPFPFVTTHTPTVRHHDANETNSALFTKKDVRTKPSFNPGNPRAASKICPMSGVEFFRVTGLPGEPVLRWTPSGSVNTGLVYAGVLKPENNPRIQRAFNHDSTLLWCCERKGRSPDPSSGTLCNSVLIDITGTKGAGGAWRILRAGQTTALDDEVNGTGIAHDNTFWDFSGTNPDRAFTLTQTQVWEWFPRTGVVNFKYNVPSGYTVGFRGGRAQTSSDGVICDVPMKQNSSGDWGGRRLNLLTGAWGPWVKNPREDHVDDEDSAIFCTTAVGPLSMFGVQRHSVTNEVHVTNHRVVNMDTAAVGIAINLSLAHNDFAIIDNTARYFGEGQSLWYDVDLATGARTTRMNKSPAPSAHSSCRCIKDTWQNRPGAGGSPNNGGGGATVGLRYGLCARSGGATTTGDPPITRIDPAKSSFVIAVRLGRNDVDVCRYIINPRCYRREQASEFHPSVSPDWEYVAFPSNWVEATHVVVPGSNITDSVQTYVALVPPAFVSKHNSGTAE